MIDRTLRLATVLAPWSPVEAARWAALIVIGHAVSIVGWWQVADATSFDDQTGPTTLAVTGLIVAGVGHVSLLLRGRLEIEQRERVVFDALVAAVDTPPPSTAANLVVGSPESSLYHRPECPLVAGRTWAETKVEPTDRVPCRVCRP